MDFPTGEKKEGRKEPEEEEVPYVPANAMNQDGDIPLISFRKLAQPDTAKRGAPLLKRI